MGSRSNFRRLSELISANQLGCRIARAASSLPDVKTIFPAVFTELIDALALEASCSPWMILPSIISICGMLMGSRANVILDCANWRSPPIFWSIVLAFSGMGKSPAYSKVLSALKRAEKELRELLHEYKIQQNVTPDDDSTDPPPKVLKFHLSGKTFEKMFDSLLECINPEQVGFEDEMGTLFEKMDLCHKSSQGGGGLDRNSVLSLKNGGEWDMKTCSNAGRYLERTHVILTGFTQPERFLSLNQNNADGLMNRFNIFIPEVKVSMYKDTGPSLAPEKSFSATDAYPVLQEIDRLGAVPSTASSNLATLFKRVWLFHHSIEDFGIAKVAGYWIAEEPKEAFVEEYDNFQMMTSRMLTANGQTNGAIFSKVRNEIMNASAIIHVMVNILHSMKDNISADLDKIPAHVSKEAIAMGSRFVRAACEQRFIFLDDKTNLQIFKGQPVNGGQELLMFEKDFPSKMCARLIRATTKHTHLARTAISNNRNFGSVKDLDRIFVKFESLNLGIYERDHPEISMGGKFAAKEMKAPAPVFIKKIPDPIEVPYFINVLDKLGLTLQDWTTEEAAGKLFPSKTPPVYYAGGGFDDYASQGMNSVFAASENPCTGAQTSDNNLREQGGLEVEQAVGGNKLGNTENEGERADSLNRDLRDEENFEEERQKILTSHEHLRSMAGRSAQASPAGMQKTHAADNACTPSHVSPFRFPCVQPPNSQVKSTDLRMQANVRSTDLKMQANASTSRIFNAVDEAEVQSPLKAVVNRVGASLQSQQDHEIEPTSPYNCPTNDLGASLQSQKGCERGSAGKEEAIPKGSGNSSKFQPSSLNARSLRSGSKNGAGETSLLRRKREILEDAVVDLAGDDVSSGKMQCVSQQGSADASKRVGLASKGAQKSRASKGAEKSRASKGAEKSRASKGTQKSRATQKR